MKKIMLVILSFVICGCQMATVQTPTPDRLPTIQMIHEAPTPLTVATPIPLSAISPLGITSVPVTFTSTPLTALQTNGPYLAYFKQIEQNWFLVLADANGVGRKQIALPAGVSEYDLSDVHFSPDNKKLLIPRIFAKQGFVSSDKAGWYLVDLPEGNTHFLTNVDDICHECFKPTFSPDGQWLVFYTSNLADESASVPRVMLNLMQLSTRKIVHQIDLLPPGYPKNFEKMFAALPQKVGAGMEPSTMLSSLQKSFLYGLDSVAWSPNGKYMAFAGAMDGPSSDLYVYDMQTSNIRRLSDGFENIQWIDWLADGKHILHASSYYDACEGDCYSYYVATFDGTPTVKTIKNLDSYGGVNRSVGWLTPSRQILYSAANGLGTGYLRYFDYVADQTVDLYPYALNSVAFDPVSKMLLVLSLDENRPDTPIGLYLINPSNHVQENVKIDICVSEKMSSSFGFIKPVTIGAYRFAVQCKDGTALVAPDGSATKLSDRFLEIMTIPSQVQFIGVDEKAGEVVVYSADIKVVRTVKIPSFRQVVWRPDGEGAFYQTDEKLYYWRLASDDQILVDDHIATPVEWLTIDN